MEEPRVVSTVSYLFPLDPRSGSDWKRCGSLAASAVMQHLALPTLISLFTHPLIPPIALPLVA